VEYSTGVEVSEEHVSARRTTLAYLFWHWPRDGAVGTETYNRYLVDFHRTLSRARLEGFRGSATFRIEGAPWIGGAGTRGYEDWYLLEGSFALDPLNEVAVSGPRREPHDQAAQAAGGGAGGLYRLRSGEPDTVVWSRSAVWITKPPDTGYEGFYESLVPWTERPQTSLWRRQMVLGPAPEFCLLATDRLRLPEIYEPVVVERSRIWPPTKP
jgi:hypothetical protein